MDVAIYYNYASKVGCMEKQETETNAETDIGNGKRPLPIHIYKQGVHLYLSSSEFR